MASLSVGHDSNAIALGDAQPLPSDISNQSGSFVDGAVTFNALAFSRQGIDQLNLSATFAGRRYGDNLSALDSNSWVLAADYQALIRRRTIGRIQTFVGGNLSDGSSTNSYVGARGSLQFETLGLNWQPWASVTYTTYNQQGFVAPADLRSGPTQSIGLNATYWWDDWDMELRGGVGGSSTHTEGTNYDSHSLLAVVGFSKELSDGVVADLNFTMVNTDYNNLDTRATPPGAFNRADKTRYFTFQLSKPVWEMFTVFGRFDVTTNNSNIPAFTYDRIVTQAGVAVTF